ncbi:hypothetical protein BCR34DRAFT_232911 [Clohesyomyces aquaticus]|uniref:Uncharacterized protein n=1 Tax=Clohesyomyces aquaticus TaxID=1231657 RepID=A0A1Y1ZW13_9PLEO|nr:hypothetical protein BCR34DRAFT_232911 [Clohesyomyces aquaticus]
MHKECRNTSKRPTGSTRRARTAGFPATAWRNICGHLMTSVNLRCVWEQSKAQPQPAFGLPSSDSFALPSHFARCLPHYCQPTLSDCSHITSVTARSFLGQPSRPIRPPCGKNRIYSEMPIIYSIWRHGTCLQRKNANVQAPRALSYLHSMSPELSRGPCGYVPSAKFSQMLCALERFMAACSQRNDSASWILPRSRTHGFLAIAPAPFDSETLCGLLVS